MRGVVARGRRRPTIGLPPHGESAAQTARAVRRPRWRSTVALAVAAFGVVMPLVMVAIAPAVLPAPFPAQHQRGGDAVLPARVRGDPARSRCVAGRRLVRAIAAGPNAAGSERARGVLAAALLGGARRGQGRPAGSRSGDGVDVVLAAAAVWWLGAGARAGARHAAPGAWPALLALERRAPAVWARGRARAAGGAACASPYLRSISVPGLVLCGLARRRRDRRRTGACRSGGCRGRWGVAADVAALGALLAAGPGPRHLPPRGGGRRPRRRARDGHHPVPPQLPARPGQRGARRPPDARRDGVAVRRLQHLPAGRPGSSSRRSATARSGC